MKTMKQVENLKKEGKIYQLRYLGIPVAEIQLESGEELTRAKAYEVVEHLMHQENPKTRISEVLVSFREIK